MDNELYVVSLVTSSERARTAVSEVMGNYAQTDLLRRIAALTDPVEAASLLGELAARIRMEFTPPQLPTAFTGEHVRQLLSPASTARLAEVMSCSPADVLATLLDAYQLATALGEVGSTRQQVLDAELLLFELIPRLPRLAARYGLDARDWGDFMERRGWLTPEATDRLAAEAGRREWDEDARPTQVLAGIMENVGVRHPHAGTRFDGYALIELHRRIGLLAERLRSEAIERAREAAQEAPDLTSVDRLPAWIELYERDAAAVGLLQLFAGAVSVAGLLQGNFSEPLPVTGVPAPTEHLQVINDVPFGALWKRRIAFDIACVIQGKDRPEVIVRCRGLAHSEYTAVRETIQRLRGSDLAEAGRTLGERLLHTHVAQREGLQGRLRLALHQYGTEVIQCALLTGVRQPIMVPSPWRDHLASQLSYAVPPPGDAQFPGLDQVEASLRDLVAETRIEVVD
jgi:hypothetical protein